MFSGSSCIAWHDTKVEIHGVCGENINPYYFSSNWVVRSLFLFKFENLNVVRYWYHSILTRLCYLYRSSIDAIRSGRIQLVTYLLEIASINLPPDFSRSTIAKFYIWNTIHFHFVTCSSISSFHDPYFDAKIKNSLSWFPVSHLEIRGTLKYNGDMYIQICKLEINPLEIYTHIYIY
jgi:hypothetical protein